MPLLLGSRRALLKNSVQLWRKTVTVESDQVSANATNFPVLLSISSDSDLVARSLNSGGDIYITESNGSTVVPHEIESFNVSTGELVLWFNAPSLSSSIDTVFYLYYGNLDATPAPDTTSVWNSDFKAVWHAGFGPSSAFANNGIDIPLAGNIISPAGYYYNNRTYVAWQGDSGLDPYITYYDHAGKTWATPVKIGTNPLSSDGHGAPAIIVDNGGTIHAMFGSHGTPMEYRTSTNTEDISVWTTQTDIATKTTYPNLTKDSSGTIHMIYRNGAAGAPAFSIDWRNSSDTFTSPTTIIDSPDAADDTSYYGTTYDGSNNRIYISWVNFDGSATKRYNIYAAYLDLSDSHMYELDGTDLGTSISAAEHANVLIESSGANHTEAPSITLDSDQNPHIIYGYNNGVSWFHRYVYWTGSAWSTPENIVESGAQFNHAAHYFSGGNIEAYLVTNADDNRSGNLEHWRHSGGAWSKVSTVFDAGAHGSFDGVNQPHIATDGNGTLRIIFCDTDVSDYTHNDLEVFAIDDDDQYLTRGLTKTTIQDSSGNKQHAAPQGGVASADEGIFRVSSFDGADDQAPIKSNNLLDNNNAFTVEAWVYPDGDNSHVAGPTQTFVDPTGQYETSVAWMESSHGTNPSQFRFYVNDGDAVFIYGSTSLENNWYHVTCTHDGSSMRIYKNGSLDTGPTVQGKPRVVTPGAGDYNNLGKDYATDIDRNWLFGKLDEVRISNTARSANWISTSYNNQNDPGTFVTLGNEEEV